MDVGPTIGEEAFGVLDVLEQVRAVAVQPRQATIARADT